MNLIADVDLTVFAESKNLSIDLSGNRLTAINLTPLVKAENLSIDIRDNPFNENLCKHIKKSIKENKGTNIISDCGK